MTIRLIAYFAVLLTAFSIGVLKFEKLSTPFKILTCLMGMTALSEGIARYQANR